MTAEEFIALCEGAKQLAREYVKGHPNQVDYDENDLKVIEYLLNMRKESDAVIKTFHEPMAVGRGMRTTYGRYSGTGITEDSFDDVSNPDNYAYIRKGKRKRKDRSIWETR